jgi:hypothetical protein
MRNKKIFFVFFWRARLRCHFFAYVAHFVYLRDVWIRTQRAAEQAGALTTTHLPHLATYLPEKIKNLLSVIIVHYCHRRIKFGNLTFYNSKKKNFPLCQSLLNL